MISQNEAKRLFADANEKYQQAAKLIAEKNIQESSQKLKEAARQYETILAGGFRHGQIYYNLANTYYRLNELGKAVLNYRKAQRFMPRNTDIEANLKLVKNMTEDKELSNEPSVVIKRLFFWLFLLNQNELIIITIAHYGILMTLGFFLVILKYSWLKKFVLGFAVCLFIVLVSLGVKIYKEQYTNNGIIITEKCQIRYGPGEEYEPKFEIHGGTECIIEDERDNWYKVYVNVGVKREPDQKMNISENVNKEIRSGWLKKENVDVMNNKFL